MTGLPKRACGQGVIGLSAIIGLILIPVIGIFAFEVARYQHGVQQLEANTDSAALAGAAMLVTSRFQKPVDRLKRFQEATIAAENAFKSTFKDTGGQLNIILGSTLTDAKNVGRNGTPQIGSAPGYCEYKVEAINPANLTVVEPTAPEAKAIRFTALFTGRPAFGRFLGLNQLVPIFSKSTAGIPVLDIVVCFDISGSMDDSTRVSLINRKWTIPEPYRSQIESAWNNYLSVKQDYINYLNSPGYDQATCEAKRNNVVNTFSDYKNLRKQLGEQHGRIEWTPVHFGTLHDCVFDPLNPNGTSINCLFPQNLNIINYTRQIPNIVNKKLPFFNCAERHYQETGTNRPNSGAENPCILPERVGAPSNFACACPDDPDGITDLVVHCDSQINTKTQQPIFGSTNAIPVGPGQRFAFTKKRNPFKGQTYVFDGIGYLTEAARGNLEPQRFAQLQDVFKNNIQAGNLPDQGQAGYQAAYFELAGKFCQPIAATIEALENFYQALQGAGSDVRFGLVTYETIIGKPAPPTDPPDPGQPPPTKSGFTEVQISDIANKDDDVPNCQFDVNSTSAGPPGPRTRPVLFMGLYPLLDPEKDLIPDPTDSTKPNLTVNEAFENYLVPLRATNIAASLKQSLDMLEKSKRKAYARQVVVLMTDGIATRDIAGNPDPTLGQQQSRDQARRANQLGIPIFTVGVAQNQPILNQQIPFLGDETTPAPNGLAALSGNGARFFAVNKNSILTEEGSQVNAISQAFLQVARSLVQLIE
ncbi:MAG TPA: hypothetical protein V6D17_21415 [Candidatus Obscuribacterales bacterium]